MSSTLAVALLGLPGAGKTTLCRRLGAYLGWDCFILGDALRVRAATDPDLAEGLARGALAPEAIAVSIIRDAAAAPRERGLILDGFPRHTEQLPVARELFCPLVGLYLDVSVEVVTARLRRRKGCRSCGWSGSTTDEGTFRCPSCGASGLQGRPEDEPEPLARRVAEADQRLRDLLAHWRGLPLIRIDATAPADEVAEHAARGLAAAQTGHPTTESN